MRRVVPMPSVARGSMGHRGGPHVVVWGSPCCGLGVSLPFPSSRDARSWALRTLDGVEAVCGWFVVAQAEVEGLALPRQPH